MVDPWHVRPQTYRDRKDRWSMSDSEYSALDTRYRQIATHSMQVRSRLTAAPASASAAQDVLLCFAGQDLELLTSDPREPVSPLRKIARAAVVDLLAIADHFGGDVVGSLSALAEALETSQDGVHELRADGDVISGTIATHHPV